MRSQHTPMSWERFEELPAHPGWKHEYWDGVAHITPGARFAVVRMNVSPRYTRSPLELRAVTATDESPLVSAYLDSFRDTVEYCDWEEEDIARSAFENVKSFFAGHRGEALSSCSPLALGPDSEDTIGAVAGAALLVRCRDGSPMLDMLFVRPRWQRRGVATALLSRFLEELRHRGETILRSRYHLANESSQAWHRKVGFTEEPDLLLAKLYLRCAAQELDRREKLSELGDEERGRLLAEKQRWERRVEKLERIAEEEGWEAVSPALRLR